MYEIYCDGASRSNPGDASIGVSINKDKVEIDTIKKKIGINTNNVAEYLGLIAALEYCVENKVNNVRIFLDSLLVVQQVNMEYKVKSKKLQAHYEKSLKLIDQIEDIEIIGPSPEIDPDRASLATFYIKNIHSNDIAEILDSKGICIRSGHHCCQPLHRYIGIKSTARISMNFTTNKDEIDIFFEKLKETINFLKINS